MAEFADTPHLSDDEPTASTASRRPSFGLLLAGLAALFVSVWALVGPFSLDLFTNVEFRWVFVIAAVAVGAVLVFSPGRRR
ncbi:hypothetical protein [Rhodococcus sp. SGAir0479]|uniref:hypothetical protein n=1 Tax=Rhodococcus sp. SGAir0479 TaxID=2567884 RepID=UPI0010CD52E5|nr:hypothetical protein [Rhodococcus sp. SGAir0479]QCQ92115.1 hypothetical protein E7742_13405 [Rhodococcus sp. SGAir0479]